MPNLQNQPNKYDHLSIETALDRAWDDMDMSPSTRHALRLRVAAINPALARSLDRFVAARRADPNWKKVTP